MIESVNDNKRYRDILIPGLITLMIFMGVIAVKGIWPFGPLTIDYYDMGQTNAPLYYHIWDFLHFKGPLIYTPYLNEGQNLSMAAAIQWNISIFNLFFYLVPRSLVFKSLSLFTGLRLVFMSVNMAVFLGKTVKAPKLQRIAMSTAYGLCGYTLTHYTIPPYLDTAALFPLLMLSLYHVLKNSDDMKIGKIRITRTGIYALCLGYMTALSYYLSFMNMIFMLLVSGTYVFLLCKKEDSKTVSLKLVFGTLTGLAISAFILLPAACQMTVSSRFNSNMSGSLFGTIKDILWAIGADMYYIKGFVLLGSFAAIAFIVTGLLRFRKERRMCLFLCLYCFYPCALIIFESINLLWHMGTYYHYPIRCGYLIPFVLLTSGAYFAGRISDEREEGVKKTRLTGYAIFTSLAVIFTAGILKIYLSAGVWEIKDLFRAYLVFCAIFLCIYLVCILAKRNDIMVIFLMAELLVGAYIGYGCPNFTDRFSSDPEQSGEYVEKAVELAEKLGIEQSETDRIKNPDTQLNANYGMVIKRATVGGWANTATRSLMDNAMAFGYSAHFMRILDSGGTLLSDAMLHVTQTLTCKDDLYTGPAYIKKSEADDFTLFDNKYVLPFAMKTDAGFEGVNGRPGDLLEITNRYYNELYLAANGEGNAGEILKEYEKDEFRVNEARALYLYGDLQGEVKVNGNVIPVPTLGDTDNTEYPAAFNSNLLYLGIYENEDICIENAGKAIVTGLDIGKLEELCGICGDDLALKAEKGRIELTIEGEEGQQALLPLSYDRGFKAYVNGKETRVKNIDSMFIGIDLEEGLNTVVVRFMPFGSGAGFLISIIGMAVALTVFPLCSAIKPKGLCHKLLGFVYFAVLTLLYIIPIAAFILHQILKRL